MATTKQLQGTTLSVSVSSSVQPLRFDRIDFVKLTNKSSRVTFSCSFFFGEEQESDLELFRSLQRCGLCCVRLAKAHVRRGHSAAPDHHAICRMKSIYILLSCADAVTRRQSDTAASGRLWRDRMKGHSAVVGFHVRHDGGTPTNPWILIWHLNRMDVCKR